MPLLILLDAVCDALFQAFSAIQQRSSASLLVLPGLVVRHSGRPVGKIPTVVKRLVVDIFARDHDTLPWPVALQSSPLLFHFPLLLWVFFRGDILPQGLGQGTFEHRKRPRCESAASPRSFRFRRTLCCGLRWRTLGLAGPPKVFPRR